MHYHILLTELCNSKCKYCYEKSMIEENDLNKKFKFDFSSPASSELSLTKLKKFIEKDKDAVIIFYGGEPLLEPDKMAQIMDALEVPFRIQTNGKLLHQVPNKYLKKISRMLISIDGDKKRTDFNKGQGTYNEVLKNIKDIRNRGYKGEIVARMTISNFPDLYEQVLHLIQIGFTSIHWQLDAGFYKHDYNFEKFRKFSEEYNKSVSRLIDYWINEMRQGTVLKLYPFLGIVESLLKGEPTKLRCGAGYAGYAITTDGKIVACPIMNCIEDFKAGDLNSDPSELKKFDVSGRCNECNIRQICGGRCLYWNQTNLWPKEGDDLICNTIKHLVKELQNKIPEIKKLLTKKTIHKKQFNYEKYFGPEIIP